MELTAKRKYEQLKIYVDGTLHLHLKLLDLIGFQSWIHVESEYFIEFYFTEGKITCAYGKKEMWKEVLRLLDEHITT